MHRNRHRLVPLHFRRCIELQAWLGYNREGAHIRTWYSSTDCSSATHSGTGMCWHQEFHNSGCVLVHQCHSGVERCLFVVATSLQVLARPCDDVFAVTIVLRRWLSSNFNRCTVLPEVPVRTQRFVPWDSRPEWCNRYSAPTSHHCTKQGASMLTGILALELTVLQMKQVPCMPLV